MQDGQTRPLALYVHIPFCRAKCLYCSFLSKPAGSATQSEYVDLVSEEIERFFETNPGWHVRTVYVGGGTPSMLSVNDLRKLLSCIARCAPEAEEVSFEANPHPDDIEKISVLLSGGVNRISVGVQSFDDRELGIAGRLQTSEHAERFLDECRRSGFNNISVDLIFGLPGQDTETFRRSLLKTLEHDPEHISLYGLTLEPESRLGQLPECKLRSLGLPDGDAQADMYDLARETLTGAGYVQYEISNFAKPGFECRHNSAYWSGEEYVGFGPGATSYLDGARFRRISDVDSYIDAQRNGRNTVEYLEHLSQARAAAEAVVLGLRRASGIEIGSFENRFGIRLSDLCGEALEKYRAAGLLEVTTDSVRLTDRAYFVSNAIFREIIP